MDPKPIGKPRKDARDELERILNTLPEDYLRLLAKAMLKDPKQALAAMIDLQDQPSLKIAAYSLAIRVWDHLQKRPPNEKKQVP
jgi:hypothetical protein